MKRKLCALLLSSAMVLAALTGCGAKSESASTPAPEESAPVSAQETQQAPEAPAAEASVEEASAVEAAPQEEGISKYVTPDNIEERIAGRPSVELPIADDDTTFTFWTGSPAMDATITGWNDSTAVQELEKRTGVHIDYIEVAPPAQSESLNLMFASGDFPDILNYAITGSPFLAAMGGYMGPAAESSPQSFYYDDNDELVYSFITDTYKEYLTLMADWYKEGLITRDLLNSDMLDSSAITSGSYAVFWQDCQFMSMWTEAGKVDDPDYALAGISEPLMEEGQTVGFGDITDISINLMVCTSCDDPETALEWLDYHFSEDGSILCQYGIEGEGLEYKDGKPNYSDLISNNPDGLSTDNALNAYAINMNMFASNGTTLRAAYDEVQQEALNAWNDKREVTKSSFTNLFTLDADETATVQRYYADISTYVAEQVGKFLIGEADIDENWDTFVETVESMGIDEVIDAYTTAGERYFGRLD